jgi:caffeoyl-CoA O-methyltransferase
MLTLTKPEIETYVSSKTEPEPPLLIELRQETEKSMAIPQMLTGHVAGRFLKQLVSIIGAERVLEIGTFTGYSALCLAEGLADAGEVITCEIDPKAAEIAHRYFARSLDGRKIELRLGDALATIADLEPEFDFVFIDADKESYIKYYEAVLPLVRFGGVIVVDNVLWSGAVLNPQTDTDKAICRFNDHILADDRVQQVMLTIRDGMTLIRKR